MYHIIHIHMACEVSKWLISLHKTLDIQQGDSQTLSQTRRTRTRTAELFPVVIEDANSRTTLYTLEELCQVWVGVCGCEAWRNLLWTLEVKTGEKGLMISAKRGGTSHDLNTHEFGVQGKERRWEYLTNSASEDWTESGFLMTSVLTNSWTQNTGKEETRISRELSKPKSPMNSTKKEG